MSKKTKKVVRDTKNRDNSKRKNKIFSIVFLVLFSVFIIYGLVNYFLNPVQKVTVIQGEISQEESTVGYIVRDESIISTNMVSDIMLTMSDGSRAGKDEIVATYVSKTKKELEEKIVNLDKKIQEAMENQSDIYSNDTRKIESDIEVLIKDMMSTNEMQKIMQYKKEINTLIQKKAKMIGELSPSGSYISQLINERNGYERELNESTDYIKTNIAGVISTRVDGLENTLNVNDLSSIKYSDLEGYALRTDEIIATSNKSLKVIDNYYCYIIAHVKELNEEKYKVGSMISIRLNYGNATKTRAEIINIVADEKGKMLVLKITKAVEDLINYRKVSFDIIWNETVGYKIPNAAVTGSGNNATVILSKYGLEYVVRVKILQQNEDYCIITDLSASDIEELNLSSNDVKRKINIYDELIIR